MEPRSVGFIGLGTMGLPMAKNLAEKLPSESKLFVFDVFAAATSNLEASQPSGRINICETAAEVTNRADILITIVPAGAHVRKVFLDETAGVLAANIKGKILIDCSTIDTETSRLVAEEVRRKDQTAFFCDAPISGGSLGAEKGTLTFMVGCAGNDERWPTLERLLCKMGKSIIPCGKQSMGLVAKLSNNYCSGLIAIATAEAMNSAMRAGMDPRILAKIFSTSTAQSTICDKWCPVPGITPDAPSSHGYKGGFKVQLMYKDFSLAVDAAKSAGATLYLADAGLQVYKEASEDARCADLDSRVVFRYLGGDENWKDSVLN
ncbi:Uncharacterized protein TPAR_08403 [Tolypocladium paradoxum]|uniref:3-hydroxyisobutyrate dehydrogenase n=1 Tax=Tolypocladium paradoxum TaxID=94208 RepID=A0A2S4KML8_9HYPO|nr:Uncharacterized protein TPAR_08403 [Tolypocladium paradoxum]